MRSYSQQDLDIQIENNDRFAKLEKIEELVTFENNPQSK